MKTAKWLWLVVSLVSVGVWPAFGAEPVDVAALAKLVEQQSRQIEELTARVKQLEAQTGDASQLKKDLQETKVSLAETNSRVDKKLQLGQGIDSGSSLMAAEKSAPAKEGATVTIMVASSAQDAVGAIARVFTAETGTTVKIVPGGSNTLATQILNGAPADLFLSASQEWADKVKGGGQVARMCPLLTNDLVLIVPKDNPANVTAPADLLGTKVGRVALAGEEVPCGRYAQQALTAAKLYAELLKGNRLARGRDVRATLRFVEQGEAEVGIVYSTDAAMFKGVKIVHTFDRRTYDPIVYPLILLDAGETNPAARAFYDYLPSSGADEIFRTFGFGVLTKEHR